MEGAASIAPKAIVIRAMITHQLSIWLSGGYQVVICGVSNWLSRSRPEGPQGWRCYKSLCLPINKKSHLRKLPGDFQGKCVSMLKTTGRQSIPNVGNNVMGGIHVN